MADARNLNTEHWWNDTHRVKPKWACLQKSCLSATLLATDHTRTGLGSSPSLGGERPSASRLRHRKVATTGKVTMFMCDNLLCHDSIIYEVCVSQNTTIIRQQSLCVFL